MRAIPYAMGGGVMLFAYWGCFLGSASQPSIAVCPSDLQPTFNSISTKILMTSSCGTDGTGCHSQGGALNSGVLDFSTDPYHALLGADGGGEPVRNISGDAGRPCYGSSPATRPIASSSSSSAPSHPAIRSTAVACPSR